MADEKTYTLPEAKKILAERERQDKMHRTIHNLRKQNEMLKGLNKSIKKAHKDRVTLTHRQENHIAKLYDIIERMGRQHPTLVSEARDYVKSAREEKRRQKDDSFRHNRRSRRHRAAQRKSTRLAQEASDRQKEAERVRLALEAKRAEERAVPARG
jgi:hypothetical protein